MVSHSVKACEPSIDFAANFILFTSYCRHTDCLALLLDMIYACPLIFVQIHKLVGSWFDAAIVVTNISVSGVCMTTFADIFDMKNYSSIDFFRVTFNRTNKLDGNTDALLLISNKQPQISSNWMIIRPTEHKDFWKVCFAVFYFIHLAEQFPIV